MHSVPAFMVLDLRKFAYEDHQDLKLGLLIGNARLHDASDSRDKIYALLGLASDRHDFPLIIDYKLSVAAVYTATCRMIVNRYRVDDVLLMVESSEREPSCHGLPSWVPDFTTKQTGLEFLWTVIAQTFCAHGGHDSVTGVGVNNVEVLVLTGLRIGEISSTSTYWVDSDASVTLIDYTKKSRGIMSKAKATFRSMKKLGRTPLNTSWGPKWARAGDIIVIVRGCGVPLLIRRGEEYYLFVGMCMLIEEQIATGDPFDWKPEDSAFSDVMRGSAWEEVGRTVQEEEFRIH